MALPPNIRLVELDTVGSTNDYAKSLAHDGAGEGTLVFAHEQTAGKGRQGNVWTSNRGNLFMSLILKPDVSAQIAGQISFVAAIALAKTLESLLPQGVHVALKWPNDVLLDGKKSAGILLETEAQAQGLLNWMVLGIGVNVAHAPENAVSLKDCGYARQDVREVLETLVANVMMYYALWKENGFEPVRAEWVRRAHHLGKEINVRLPRETFAAVFDGIDAQGALQARMADGQKRLIHSGEVYFT